MACGCARSSDRDAPPQGAHNESAVQKQPAAQPTLLCARSVSPPPPRPAQDLDSLSALPRLKYLSLLDNPVAKQPNYRLYVIARCKKLKMLDFRKVKLKVCHGWGSSGWD